MSFAYEIEYKGKTIRCRTLTDARRVLDELEESKLTKEGTPWTSEEFNQFTNRIHHPQRRLLAKLLENGTSKWITDSALCDLLGLEGNKALAGTLSGISKVALMFEIEPRRVYTQRTAYKHAKPTRLYQITPSFLDAAKKHNWPSKSDLREGK